MAKKITRTMKIMAMGQKLGPYGIGAKFCQDFNAKTGDRRDELVPCVLTIYEDKTFEIVLKTSPVTYLLKKATGIEKGSSGKTAVAHISKDEVKKIAEYKLPDLNVDSLDAAIRSVEGTAKSMGIIVD